MHILNIFSPLLGSKETPQTELEADRIISYVRHLVNREDLIQDISLRLGKISKLSDPERELAQIPLYLLLEDFITRNKPLVVKREFTRETLREDIKNQFDLTKLSGATRLIFLSDLEQTLALFELGAQKLSAYIIKSIGIDQLRLVVKQITQKSILQELQVSESALEFGDLSQSSLPDITAAFKLLYSGFYKEIKRFLGEEIAASSLDYIYSFVKNTYNYELVFKFLEVLPEGVLERERIRFLSREDVEKIVVERTRELESAKEVLKEERDRAHAIISSMGEGMYVVDREGKILSVNPVAEELLKVPGTEMMGQKFTDIVTLYQGDDVIQAQASLVAKTLATGEINRAGVDDDIYLETLKRSKFPAGMTTTPLLGNGVTGAVIVFRDITREKAEKRLIEKKVAERTRELQSIAEALKLAKDKVSEGLKKQQQEKARLTASINSLSLGFLMTDLDKNVVITNPAFTSIMGIEKPLTLTEVAKHLGVEIDLIKNWQASVNEKRMIDLKEIQFAKKYLRIFLAPIISREPDEHVIGTVILFEDVTETKALERSKDEFFTIASHELRTPLTAIRGLASIICDYYADKLQDEDVKKMIDDIKNSSVRLIGIVNEFLNLSSIEQGKIKYTLEAFDTAEIIKEAFTEVEHIAKEKHLTLKFLKATEELPQAYADKQRVKQVMLNLLSNALKFADTGGVTVTLTKVAENSRDYIKVAVADTGKGIPVESQYLLFRKFQQTGDNLYTRDVSGGTGLGLYISKLLLEGMGGRIYLESSNPGAGAEFAFIVPIAEPGKNNV